MKSFADPAGRLFVVGGKRGVGGRKIGDISNAQFGRGRGRPAGSCGMNLYQRKVVHPQAHENYRVVLKRGGDEFEIGSIGVQHGAAWRWGIDTVIPMRNLEAQGEGKDRRDCKPVQGDMGAVCCPRAPRAARSRVSGFVH